MVPLTLEFWEKNPGKWEFLGQDNEARGELLGTAHSFENEFENSFENSFLLPSLPCLAFD